MSCPAAPTAAGRVTAYGIWCTVFESAVYVFRYASWPLVLSIHARMSGIFQVAVSILCLEAPQQEPTVACHLSHLSREGTSKKCHTRRKERAHKLASRTAACALDKNARSSFIIVLCKFYLKPFGVLQQLQPVKGEAEISWLGGQLSVPLVKLVGFEVATG